MNSVELPSMVDAVLLFLFLWIAGEQRKMRPDSRPKFDPSWGWSKKVRPLVMPRDLSAFVTVTEKLGFRSEKVTAQRDLVAGPEPGFGC